MQCFVDTFGVEEQQLAQGLEYNAIDEWDSIGHMTLIAALEEAFSISMEIDDVIEFSSFDKGFELLAKYGVEFAAEGNAAAVG
jgi:acyl carrier protein